MTDVIDYVGRMTDRMGLLEDKMDVLKTQLTRVRAHLVMEFVASIETSRCCGGVQAPLAAVIVAVDFDLRFLPASPGLRHFL